MTRSLYRAVWALARPLAAMLARGDGKLARTARGRLGAVAALEAWSGSSRDTTRPLVWFHAASVGEGRQAEAVIAQVRALRPRWQVAFTHSSASAERFAETVPADVAGYLPPDTPADSRAALDALRPAALVFSATDLWPELVRQARVRGVALGLVSATLAPTSSRRGAFARRLLHEAYTALDAVGAIDPRDAEGLAALGVRSDRIAVTGDTRHDAAAQRAAAGAAARPARLACLDPDAGPIVVAGSTWPGDERVLLPAVADLRSASGVRLVIAPHEPTDRVLERLERDLDRSFGRAALIRRLSDLEHGHARGDAGGTAKWDVCVVDRTGVLFDLYAAARVAWVGGGFHAAGLHSVIEPAALGVPVVFGPRWQGSRDARLLLEAGGGASADTVSALAAILRRWLDDTTTARAAAGAAARAVVTHGAGAAARSAQLVLQLVERPGDAVPVSASRQSRSKRPRPTR